MFDNFDDILTVKNACEALGIGKNTLYKLIHNGELKAISLGKKYLIPKHCLIAFVNLKTSNLY